MQKVKKVIPASWRLWFAITRRRCKDLFNGHHKKFAAQYCNQDDLFPILTIDQAIRPNTSTANKVHNLSLAINKLNNIIIEPGRIFSFWQLVGDPSQKKGYQKSRSIIAGEVEAAIGGGLCQLSGLIYFLAIRTGLTITERHAHSLDIYKEEERFTPLGSDATIAFGYKDLRLFNPYPFAVSFSFQLTPELLTGTISAAEKITPCTIDFEYRKNKTHTEVTTINKTSDKVIVIAHNNYTLLQSTDPVS